MSAPAFIPQKEYDQLNSHQQEFLIKMWHTPHSLGGAVKQDGIDISYFDGIYPLIQTNKY